MLEIIGKTNIDFMGKRKIAFILSGIIVLIGLVAVVQIARGAANLGIDFAEIGRAFRADRDTDAAGHRRYSADDWDGRRLERVDLRAYS